MEAQAQDHAEEERVEVMSELWDRILDEKARADKLAALVREALAKGPERRCPWCWTVAHHGKHAKDCRAMAALKESVAEDHK